MVSAYSTASSGFFHTCFKPNDPDVSDIRHAVSDEVVPTYKITSSGLSNKHLFHTKWSRRLWYMSWSFAEVVPTMPSSASSDYSTNVCFARSAMCRRLWFNVMQNSPIEYSDCFTREKPSATESRYPSATQPTVHAGCFSVSVIHWTLPWTTESLKCAHYVNTCDCTRWCNWSNSTSKRALTTTTTTTNLNYEPTTS